MIVATEYLIEQWMTLKGYVEAYIWLVVVPRFCAYRGKQYLDFLMSFGKGYISECDKKVTKWQAIVDKTNDLMEKDQKLTEVITATEWIEFSANISYPNNNFNNNDKKCIFTFTILFEKV